MKVISYKGCLLLELFSKVPHFAKYLVKQRDVFIGEITTTFVCRTIVVRKCSYKKTTLYQLYFTKNVVLTRKCWFLVTLVWFLLLFGEFGNPLLMIINNDSLNVIDHEAAAHKTLSRTHHGLQQLMFAMLTFIIKKKQIMEKYDDMTDAMPTYTKKY